MPIGTPQRKTEIIEVVAQKIRSCKDLEQRELSERFARKFYEQVSPGDLDLDTPDNHYAAALAMYRFGHQREAGTPLVRVFSPSLERDGWDSRHTIVEVITDDMPFLVDSMTAFLSREQAEIQLVIHPIMCVERDADGVLCGLRDEPADRQGCLQESYMHIQVRSQPEERLANLEEGIVRVLEDVRAAVEDFGAMRERCAEIVTGFEGRDDIDAAEEIAFLTWLQDEHFTFLGYRRYEFDGDSARVVREQGLGVLRDKLASVFDGLLTGGRRPPGIDGAGLLRITKANRPSTIHRPVPMDAIGIKHLDDDGNVIGEHLFIGLYTSAAYGESARKVPILRRKVSSVLERTVFQPDSYNYKALVHILDTYPRDELFQISEDELHDIAVGILNLQDRQRIAIFPRIDPLGRFVSCLVYAPRDRYDTQLRLVFQDILMRAYQGSDVDFYLRLSDAPLARLHFIIRTVPGEIPDVEPDALEEELRRASRSWEDRLSTALVEAHGEVAGLNLVRRYAHAFPTSYRTQFDEVTAVADVERVEGALISGDLALNLYRPAGDLEHEVRFKLYTVGRPSPLSDVVPTLENLGLRVVREDSYRLRPTGVDSPVWIRDFVLTSRGQMLIDLARVRDGFHEAFALVWRREMESDAFNHLVLLAGLDARQVTVLRAYCKYLRQVRIPFSHEYMERTLSRNPAFATLLVKLFEARFDPTLDGDREATSTAISQRVVQDLEGVKNLDEDRILRAFLSVIEATLRTNHYQVDDQGWSKGYLAFKIDSRAIPTLPRPRPLREIFVYSPRVEAVHLRGGLVARGGIRWSDRREDFRTEVLGLMKAQMVKNSVIVPVGSKGGFVCKRLPQDPPARHEEVVASYRTMMSGLLDVTDNQVGGEVVPPRNVVRHDGDDPYLVVAADKGTATFSDLANEVSGQYGFWLDDAFASGGSAGYDHKKMGITARGAWVSVQRHFREMDVDVQAEDFTVVGVGDMAGDVFGNGMLLSEHIRLVAAFNHMHIFVDPDPDAARSFAERKRLFDLPGSTWESYDVASISKGGGVWARTLKAIPVSPRMRELFDIDREVVTPNELILAILQAQVDLLWLGGIGTYVRAGFESDSQVGDHANDAIRITSDQLRAKVVGEGANLGLTQRARIAFALRGGRINTDFIDNSAGVDCSDHEVNIKILLGEVERSGEIKRAERDALLASMTDEVAALVLRNNYLQTQSVTVTQHLGVHLLDRMGRFMRRLEKDGHLDRKLEFLPDDDELTERFSKGVALSRPEICTLLSYAKLVLYDELLTTSLPDDPSLQDDLTAYFPTALREPFAGQIAGHRLRREIVATRVTNEIVNRVGIAFVHEMREKTGRPAEDVARAYLVARDVFGAQSAWEQIEALDNQVPARVQSALLAECGRLIERGTAWFLRHGSHPLDITAEIESYGPGVTELMDSLDELLEEEQQVQLEHRAAPFIEDGAPSELAHAVARAAAMPPACDIVRLVHKSGLPVQRVARAYIHLGSRFGINWLRRAAAALPSDTAWEKLAVTALFDDLDGHQIELTRRVLVEARNEQSVEEAVQAWAETRGPLVGRAEQLIAELQTLANPDLPMLAVASRQLRGLSE